jgi:hypothetical protein
MKGMLRCLPMLLLICSTLSSVASVKPVKRANATEKFYKNFPGLKGVTLTQLLELSPREYEKATGKKLKLKEKVVYKIVKWKLKKKMQSGPTEKQKTLGMLSLVFGALAVALVFVPYAIAILGVLFAIAGFVLGLRSLKGNSNAPGLIGLILSSSVILLVVLAFIAIASWGWYD